MAFFHGSRDIHHGQEHKTRVWTKDVKIISIENRKWNKPWDQKKNNQKNDIFAFDIAE